MWYCPAFILKCAFQRLGLIPVIISLSISQCNYSLHIYSNILSQAYKFDQFSTTSVSRLVEPLSFVAKLEFLKKLIEFLSIKIEFIEGNIIFLHENVMDFW